MIAAEGCDLAEKVVRDQNRLCPPGVRVGGHQVLAALLRLRDKGCHQAADLRAELPDVSLQVETQVERHLLVAGPPGVEPFARLADALDQHALDKRMDVFVRARDERGIPAALVEDRVQAPSNRLAVSRADDAGRCERLGPRQAARHVLVEEARVEGQ